MGCERLENERGARRAPSLHQPPSAEQESEASLLRVLTIASVTASSDVVALGKMAPKLC